MERLTFRFAVAALTFILGVSAAAFWIVHRKPANANQSNSASRYAARSSPGAGGTESRQHSMPPPLEARNCGEPEPAEELPNDRFARKGGRETQVKVFFEGDALTASGIEQGRDLSRYETLNLVNPNRHGKSVQVYAQARTFVWDHWRAKKHGYLVLTSSSVDATSTSHIFVEQDDTGRWRVAWRIVRHSGEIDDLPTYYGVMWVVPQGWDVPGKPLAPNEQPDPRRHELEFLDKCGDIEQSL